MQTDSRAIWVAALVLVPLNVIWFMEAPRGPYDKLYPVVPALFAGIGSWLFQGGHVKQALASGERLNSVWRQCLVIVLALLAMVPVVAVLITYAPDW